MSRGDMEPYRGGGGYPGHDHDDTGRVRYIRARPVGLKTIAAISTAQWIGRRVATRLTPFFLLFLALVGVPLAFWTDPEVILTLGFCLTMITYATQRHVSLDDKLARQWALRSTMLPVAATCWVMLWWAMHRRGLDVINKHMFLAYLVFGCLAWAWLYVSKFVGVRVAWERAQRDFAPMAKAAGLAGAAVVKTVRTRVGDKLIVDVRGTGQTPAQIVRAGQVGELIGGHDGLPPGRVQVAPSATHAGYVEVSRWVHDPWKHPIPHPGEPEFPFQRVVPATRIPVGRDPETGEDLYFELVNDDGGVHWVFIAGTRGGKTNLINNVVEYMTRCVDRQGRPLVRITMIDILKGFKDAANWAPAVHAVHAGPNGVPGALASLQQAVNLISQRAEQNGRRGRSKHEPTAAEPIELIIIDEASFLLTKRTRDGQRAIELVNAIMKGGASELVLVLVAAQRAVMDHLGSNDVKANAFGVVVLPVRREVEQSMIINDWREQGMPNMRTYGNGNKGTALVVLNTEWSAGRMFELWRLSTIRKIALGRVLPENAAMVDGMPHRMLADAAAGKPAAPMHVKITGTTDRLVFDTDPLASEPPADGVDGGVDAGRPSGVDADDLDFDAGMDEVDAGMDGPVEVRPGDRSAPDYVVASGPGAEDDEAVELARELAEAPDAVSNVTPLDPDAPPWVRVESADERAAAAMRAEAIRAGEIEDVNEDEMDIDYTPSRTDGLDAVDRTAVEVDRMAGVLQWAASREQGRDPNERAELVTAWREHTWRLDQGVRLPASVNAYLRTLAEQRGAFGFTRAEAQDGLRGIGAVDGKTSVASYLRVLVNQGHLDRQVGAGRDGADLFYLGERHRKEA